MAGKAYERNGFRMFPAWFIHPAKHEILNNGTQGKSRKETEHPDNEHHKDQPEDEKRTMI